MKQNKNNNEQKETYFRLLKIFFQINIFFKNVHYCVHL